MERLIACPICHSVDLQQCSPPNSRVLDYYCYGCDSVWPFTLLVSLSIVEPILVDPEVGVV